MSNATTTFMKPDTTEPPDTTNPPLYLLPHDLLNIRPPLPIDLYKPGQLYRPYDLWAYAKCHPQHLPLRKSSGTPGHDIFSTEEAVISPNGSVVVDTGLSIRLPQGHYGKIEGCSSLGLDHSIIPFGSVIDEEYRGVIQVKLFNRSEIGYTVRPHDKIAQLIIHRYAAPVFQHVGQLEFGRSIPSGFGLSGR